MSNASHVVPPCRSLLDRSGPRSTLAATAIDRIVLLGSVVFILAGCTTARQRPFGIATRGEDLQLDAGAPTRIKLQSDSVVAFAHVRLLGDSVYGWLDSSAQPGDSVAIPLDKILSVEQRTISVSKSVGFVALVTLCALGYVFRNF